MRQGHTQSNWLESKNSLFKFLCTFIRTFYVHIYVIQRLTLNDKTTAQIDRDNHAKQWQTETRITEIIRKHQILGEVFQKRIHTILTLMNLKTVLSSTS